MSYWHKVYYREEYLKSDHWRTVRIQALLDANAVCCICGVQSIANDAHHIFYPERWTMTRAEHLRVLCRVCHDRVHEWEPSLGKAENLDQSILKFEIIRRNCGIRPEASLVLPSIPVTPFVSKFLKAPKPKPDKCFFCSGRPCKVYQFARGPTHQGKCLHLCDSCINEFPRWVQFSGIEPLGHMWQTLRHVKDARFPCKRKNIPTKLLDNCPEIVN